MFYRNLKIAIISSWLVLLGLLVGRDLFVHDIDHRELAVSAQAGQERFYGIWFDRQRIGYVEKRLSPEGEDILLTQHARLLLTVLETTQPVEMRVTARLSGGLELRDFDFQFTSPFYTMSARGRAEGNVVHFTLDTGQTTVSDTITLSGPPLLAVNDRAYLLRELTSPGQKIRISSFDPFSLSGRQSVITYHGEEKELVGKRIRLLHHYSELFSGIRINFWLDEDGRVVKEESPAGFTFIAEPEFRAKDLVESGNDLLSAVAVPYRGELPPENAGSITYRLDYPAKLDLDLQGGRQSLMGDLLTVSREGIPSGSGTTANSGGCNDPVLLRPSRYVQSDNTRIISLARSIVGSETDPLARVRLLTDWLYDNLEKRPVIGLPDALTTLKNRRGDCNEHASLFAALARALGIPTAIATGVTLQNKAFYYHAWNEVCINNGWYSLDTTINQMPADLFHIRFGRGDLEEQLKIGALLGRLKINIHGSGQ